MDCLQRAREVTNNSLSGDYSFTASFSFLTMKESFIVIIKTIWNDDILFILLLTKVIDSGACFRATVKIKIQYFKNKVKIFQKKEGKHNFIHSPLCI